MVSRLAWIPDQARVDRVVLKNARGHVYLERGEAMLGSPSSAWAPPLSSLSEGERTAFEQPQADRRLDSRLEIPRRTMKRHAPSRDMSDGWIVVEKGNYRYSVDRADGMRVRTVVAEYLATEVRWHENARPPNHEFRSTPLLKKLGGLTAAIERGRSRTTCLRLWSAFIRERDDHRCVSCGSTARLSAHHICRKSFLAAGQFLPGNGITLCRDCHRKGHDGFNRKPDLSRPMDAQGGEKLALMERLYSLLLSDALCRRMLNDELYFLNDEVLGCFRRMQGYPDSNPFPGSRLEQAYLSLAEPEGSVVNAILEANGLPVGDAPLFPGGFIAGFNRPGESPETMVVRSYRPRSE
ncbi:MAG: HNH endonuclease [Microvirga sp.]